MALSDIELKHCERALAKFMARRRPPMAIRDRLDLGYRVKGQSIEVFEIRPDWHDATKSMDTPVAKATYVRTENRWKLFWMRRDLKWHGYDPLSAVSTLDEVLAVIGQDEYGCFFG